MGSYCELEVGHCNIFSNKSYVAPEVMSLFSRRDRSYVWMKYVEAYPGDVEWGEDEDDVAVCQYRCNLSTVKKRLDILGFDLPSTLADFEKHRQAEINKLEEWVEDDDESHWFDTLKILKASGFSQFIQAYKEIFREGSHCLFYKDKHPECSGLIKYIIDDDFDGSYMGFPCSDIRYFFRFFLEVVAEDSEVVLDMSELVTQGYYEFDDEITSIAYKQLTADYPVNAKIIVLCEGASDKAILERSMTLLYPDFSEHYSFMDFNVTKASGGAPALVSTLKAFVAAGIENRIIALFDNDTAARSARKPLSGFDLPKHIKVISYPNADFLRRYPTIGPGGIQELDVNGLAGSIELYLGKDCIEDEENNLTPVQWKGYVQDLDSYHGEVINKSKIQKIFYKKLESCELNSENIKNHDWTGIKLILEEIFHCFVGDRAK